MATIDAMGTQKEIAEKIIEKEADYILQVKGNQETLMEDTALYFEKDIFPYKKKDLKRKTSIIKKCVLNMGDRKYGNIM